jgi:hypothetical protein
MTCSPRTKATGEVNNSRVQRELLDQFSDVCPRHGGRHIDRKKPSREHEARRGILTANATTPYYLGFADLSAGPLVLEMPARGVQGAINDSWQNAIPGTEAPGKYLVLAPGQEVPADVAGYVVRRSPTVNVFLGVRLTDTDPGVSEGRAFALTDVSLRSTFQLPTIPDAFEGYFWR